MDPRSPRTLVVGAARVDGVDEEVRAAAGLARRCDARLYVVHAVQPPHAADASWLSGAATARLHDTLSRALEAVGIGATVEVGEGPAGPLLCRAAEERGADLVVVGATRQGPGFAHLLGSTAERVLRECGVPVLVLRGSLQGRVSRVLYTTDLSPHSLGAVVRGRSMVECLFGTPEVEECLLVAGYGLSSLPPLRGRTLAEVARDELGRFVARVPGEARLTARVRTGAPAKEIVAEAAAMEVELTVLGTHARNGAEHFFLGSVAEQVLATTFTHALVVPTGARARFPTDHPAAAASGAA
jgi:universal stress protein E